jgi:hypothetical protein
VDASTLTGSETEIRGYQFDMSFNASWKCRGSFRLLVV